VNFSRKKLLLGLIIVGGICILTLIPPLLNNRIHVSTFNLNQTSNKTVLKGDLTSSNFIKTWQIGTRHHFGFENLSIVNDPSGRFEKVIHIIYPKGSSSPSYATSSGNLVGGAQFLTNLQIKPTDSLHLRYSLRFADNFNFVRGGKLPGLYGGDIISKGDIPDGTNGFSTRYMWREKGIGEVDAYLPIDTRYGTSQGRGSFQFTPGKWYTLEQEVDLNTPKKSDGRIKVWVNGKQVMDIRNLEFRSTDSLKIQGIFFSTFFGGHDASWATPNDTYADFANFAVCDCYIGI
jgi:hypothetical protein